MENDLVLMAEKRNGTTRNDWYTNWNRKMLWNRNECEKWL